MSPLKFRLWIVVCAILGALVGILWPTARQTVAQTPTPPSHGAVATPTGAYRGPEYCGTSQCHPQEYSQWKGSRHSIYSISPDVCSQCHSPQGTAVASTMPEVGVPNPTPTSVPDTVMHSTGGSCAACHTTGYDPATGRSVAQGVTCEACHGIVSETHPPAKMQVADEAAFCGACHKPTYAEWQVSHHGERNIKCTACHNVHSQRLRFESANQLCASCHGDRYSDFSHSTHSANGLHCANCHIYRVASRSEMGRAPTGHTFLVTSNVCANCHKDAIHQRREIPELQEKIVSLQELIPQSTTDQINDLQNQIATLDQSRFEMLAAGGAVGAVVGAAIGAGCAYWVIRRKGAPMRSVKTNSSDVRKGS